jgi:hypothetical protein
MRRMTGAIRSRRAFLQERSYGLRSVERVRLCTSYPDVVRHVRDVVNLQAMQGRCTLVVGATGVGAPMVDPLRAMRPACRIVPVTITGGDHEGRRGASTGCRSGTC